jgi:hypothetical protein
MGSGYLHPLHPDHCVDDARNRLQRCLGYNRHRLFISQEARCSSRSKNLPKLDWSQEGLERSESASGVAQRISTSGHFPPGTDHKPLLDDLPRIVRVSISSVRAYRFEELLCRDRFCHPRRCRRKPSSSSLHQNPAGCVPALVPPVPHAGGPGSHPHLTPHPALFESRFTFGLRSWSGPFLFAAFSQSSLSNTTFFPTRQSHRPRWADL